MYVKAHRDLNFIRQQILEALKIRIQINICLKLFFII